MEPNQERQKKIIENYINSYNEFNVDGMLRHLSEEVVFENISNGETNLKTVGRTAFKKQAESAKNYFTERKQVIESWAFNGNQATIGIAYSATLAIDFPNGMKAGDFLSVQGRSEFTFRDGEVIGIKDYS